MANFMLKNNDDDPQDAGIQRMDWGDEKAGGKGIIVGPKYGPKLTSSGRLVGRQLNDLYATTYYDASGGSIVRLETGR